MGDTVFFNGRAAVHKGSAGSSTAFPDVCLCPPSPPAGPIPTPLPNAVQAADLAGAASSVLAEGNPVGNRRSYFAKSTGNEVAQGTGGGVVTHLVQGKAYFQTFSMNVLVEGEPAVRHMDLLTHNHMGPQPGNTPPVPWMSTQLLPPMRAPDVVKRSSGGATGRLLVRTQTDAVVDDDTPVDVTRQDGRKTSKALRAGELKTNSDEGPVQISFREIRQAFWTRKAIFTDEVVGLGLVVRGYPDGTSCSFVIRAEGESADAPPVVEIGAKVEKGMARASWTFEPALGEIPTAHFVFTAAVEGQKAWSESLSVVPRPVQEIRGVKQRLRALGFDAGTPDDVETPALEAAIRKFQKEHELEETGKADAVLRSVLVAMFREKP